MVGIGAPMQSSHLMWSAVFGKAYIDMLREVEVGGEKFAQDSMMWIAEVTLYMSDQIYI